MPAFAKNRTPSTDTKKPSKAAFFKVQAKLKMGQSGDKYEQEADTVAQQVVENTHGNSATKVQQKPLAQTIKPGIQLKALEEDQVQKKSEEEETVQAKEEEETVQAKTEENEEETLQAKSQTTATPSTSIQERLKNNKHNGEPMAPATQTRMEQNFGTNLSDVRIHTDANAQKMSADLGAQAFTSGRDIYFNEGKYTPGSPEGDGLLAHELTHTIQQGAIATNKSIKINSVKPNKATVSSKETAVPKQDSISEPVKQNSEETKKEGFQSQENSAQTETQDPKYPTSAQENEAFQELTESITNRSRAAQTTPDADVSAQAGAAAAPRAANEQMGGAQANQVEVMNAQEPGVFDAVSFKNRLMERIEAMQLPANEEEADDFESNNDIDSVTQAGVGMANAESQQASGAINQATSTAPDPNSVAQREVANIPEAPVGQRPATVNANAAAPPPRPDSQVQAPLQQNVNEIDQQLEANQVTDDMLHNSNEPAFGNALNATNEARDHANQAPAAFRASEHASLTSAQNSAQQNSNSQLNAMHNSRAASLGSAQLEQQNTATANSAARERIASEINMLFESTKNAVETILSELEEQVASKFTTAAEKAKKVFEDYVARKIDAYKAERYSGPGGAVTWVGDAFTGLPEEVNAFFEEGREKYIEAMDSELTSMAEYIAQKLTEAKTKITEGKQQIADYVASQPQELQDIAEEAAGTIQSRFDDLENAVNSKQDELIESLAQQYQESLAEIDARIEEMQAENRGLIDMAMGAVMGVIQTIINIKNMLTNLLSAALEAIGAIISDPIGFLMNLIRGVKEGFLNFGTNIMTHLMNGLVTWLTGALGPMGITIPEDIFSLKGIFSLVMQVLGLTWDYMRQKAVKLLGEPVVQALELGFELFQIIRTEGIAGIWEYIKEQFTDLKETVIEGIQDMIITTVVDAGIKWVLGLMSPAGAFVKAAMMIIDIVKFFIERGSQIMALVNAFIEGVKAVASGNVGAIASKIEEALGRAVPVIIGFLASLLGISGLARKVQNLIQRIRQRIDKAIDKLILKAKKAFSKLVRKGKAAAGKFVDWLGIKKRFKTKDGKAHKVFLEEKGGKTEIMVQSEKQLVGERLLKAKQETQAMDDGEEKNKRLVAEANIDTYLSETRAITRKINKEEAKGAPDATKIDNCKEKLEQKLISTADDLETIGVEPGSVGTGDNAMLQEIGKKYLKKNNTELSVYGQNHEALVNTSGYHFSSSNNKKIIVRKEASDAFPKLSFDEEGKLKLGSSSGSSTPEHTNYIPKKKKVWEENGKYIVEYHTKKYDDEGKEIKEGIDPKFRIDITYAQALEGSPDEIETRQVKGERLKLKPTGGGRGKTDSAQAGFHNAHLIADRFGGSGKNSAMNIYPSSPLYNTKDMKGKEDTIANLLSNPSSTHRTANFDMSVKATIRGEKANRSALQAMINEEAKKDNELQVTDINRDMANDLTTLVRKDILGKPGQFQNVLYKVNSKIMDSDNPEAGEKEKNITKSIGIDTGYTDLINKLLKEK
ncbi:eCIS core domain-containing protein [Leeuwenhoekiella sp. CH_XMU1409-2]|uniref:eCIS core domain-containing protein n=1 Tax=Leeuwenhoekiella sp. CH_XMU1409-2 TaxID=3107768 RepID=UPI00300A035F